MTRIRISNVAMPLKHNKQELFLRCASLAKVSLKQVKESIIMRRSIDARKKEDLHYIYSVDLVLSDHTKYRTGKHVTPVHPVNYQTRFPLGNLPNQRVAVVGAGPAGLFCSYLLALNGLKPIILERGKSVEDRSRDVEQFWKTGVLDPSSNVQFGEGGAGTFSDGKLNTQVKDKNGRNRFVLQTFVDCGASEEILYDAKPHIGTDVLMTVITNLRKRIISLGGSFRFQTCMTDFFEENGKITALQLNGEEILLVDAAFFCIGHSARDSFAMIYDHRVSLEAKPFAVGFRVEHPQTMINESQYGPGYDHILPAAPYKLTYHTPDERGIYTFCMCPGGYVVNASSFEGMLAVNGMSYHDRASANANSAVVITVGPKDFPDENHPLSGMHFQEELEKKAYQLAGGAIPQQLFADFEKDQISNNYGSYPSVCKGAHAFANLRNLLPEELNQDLIEAIHAYGKKIKGYDREDAILSAVESRTSSPVRIIRDSSMQSSIKGIYPCGEGAGYAGGITSAAMDGLKCAESYIQSFCD